jgi:hypothetical protein
MRRMATRKLTMMRKIMKSLTNRMTMMEMKKR